MPALIRQTGNERFGYDAFRRLIQFFGKVALGVGDAFRRPVEGNQVERQRESGRDLEADDLNELGTAFWGSCWRHTGRRFPQIPMNNWKSRSSRFSAPGTEACVDYRREFKITPAMANGTAVNIVTMVFGNVGDDSATGVGFTRNPGTGENHFTAST